MCAQLERNVQSRAFDDYQVEWEEPVAMVSCIHRLSDRAMMEQKASHQSPSPPLCCTCMQCH